MSRRSPHARASLRVRPPGRLRPFAEPLERRSLLASPGVLAFSAPTYSVVEGQAVATITVARTEGSDGAVSVGYATSPGTALSGQDYTDVSGVVAFADGDVAPKTFTVPISDDANFEPLPNETVNLALSAPSGGAVLGAQSTATLQIIDNEPRTLSIDDVSVRESDGSAAFTVSLDAPSGQTITVLVNTASGTATSGADFSAVTNQTLSFAPGVTSQTVRVPILEDKGFEGPETFQVVLSGATNALIGRGEGTGTIVDDDAPLLGQVGTLRVGENRRFPFGFGGMVPDASFTDPNGLFPAANYSATIYWGDNTSDTATVTPSPSPGRYYVSVVSHTYASAGVFPITMAVQRFRGPVPIPAQPIDDPQAEVSTTFHGEAIVTDSEIFGTLAPGLSAVEGVTLSNAVVAQFTDTGGAEPAETYLATIDWGDGSPISPGFVAVTPPPQPLDSGSPRPPAPVSVQGTHRYAAPGTYRVAVSLQSQAGTVTRASGDVVVAAGPQFLSGILSPESDSGVSHSDAITNVTLPTFTGFATPGRIVRYFAQAPGGSARQIGQGVADASGFYRITADTPLADGSYVITADTIDAAGVPGASATIVNPLVIDTVGPQVTDIRFNRLDGTLRVALRDDRSGLDRSTVIDGANYALANRRFGRAPLEATGLSAPQVGATDPQIVTVTFAKGRHLPFGVYTIRVVSGGIADVAGNALDGEYYGTFPSGNNRPGGDFVAQVAAFHDLSRGARPVNGFASPVAPGTAPTTIRFRATHGVRARKAHAAIVRRHVKF